MDSSLYHLTSKQCGFPMLVKKGLRNTPAGLGEEQWDGAWLFEVDGLDGDGRSGSFAIIDRAGGQKEKLMQGAPTKLTRAHLKDRPEWVFARV